ncbi:MAG: serine/threonine protein kinase, partial [Chloroflexi bacterium]
AAGETLFHHDGFRFALYPRQGGHAPEFDNLDNLLILGRMLGRMHRIGTLRPFVHRPVLDSRSFGHASVALISRAFIPDEYRPSYEAVTSQLLQEIDTIFSDVGAIGHIRAHGDCHAGNILWRDNAPHFVDFDDARMAPAVQDLWMMLSGERPRQTAQLAALMEGYNEFHEFHPRELRLMEPLRALRMLHYSAWLATRWQDPIFPQTFPWFNTVRSWGEHILQLREQPAALAEPPLELP